MMKITFEEYQKVYDDISASEVYDGLYARAEYLLRGFTARRIDDVQSDTDYRYKQVKAAYIHTIHSIATSGQTLCPCLMTGTPKRTHLLKIGKKA